MENFDIIIYAVIAAFLFFRLWSVLGQTDEEGSGSSKSKLFARDESRDDGEGDVIVLEGRKKKLQTDALTEEGHALTSLAGILDRIKKEEPSFDEKAFLEGARYAFEAIVTAFAKGDLSNVQRFIGPAVSNPFQAAIKARQEAGQTLKNKIEKIAAADIVDAKIERDEIVLTVEFVSYQINQLIEADGSTEDSEKPEEIRDVWIFRKQLKSEDPNWQLIETQS